MDVFGITAFVAQSEASLIREGRVLAAADEEWLIRHLGEARFREYAVFYCLEYQKIIEICAKLCVPLVTGTFGKSNHILDE